LAVDPEGKSDSVTTAQVLADQVLSRFAASPEQILYGRGCNPTIPVLYGAVDSLVKDGEIRTAEELNNRILSFFKAHLGSKNQELIPVMERTAIIYGVRGDKENQEKSLSDAFKIASWNWGSHNTSDVRMKYASLLLELGRKDEAENIRAIEPLSVGYEEPEQPSAQSGKHYRGPTSFILAKGR